MSLSSTQSDHLIRRQLVRHLQGGTAFLPPEKFMYDIPFEKVGVLPDGVPYTLWQQLYHLRYAQKDIIDFSVDTDYRESRWPDDYWPEAAPDSEKQWRDTIAAFFKERKELEELIMRDSTDLTAPLENDSGKTLFREILLIIEHNAYHAGQMLVMMRQLGLYD